jgi:hypothetical protein
VSPATREHLRGVALLAVVAVNLLTASPLPRSVKRSQYDTPVAREEIRRWQDSLARIGIRRSEESLVEASYALGSTLSRVRHALLDPFATPYRLTGTGQAWGLFTYPDTWPHQLNVWTRDGAKAPWSLRYAGLDPEHAWRREVLTYRRVRAVYDGQTSRPGVTWERFATWIAREALRDTPGATHARVGFLRRHTRDPSSDGAARPEAPAARHLRTYAREELE